MAFRQPWDIVHLRRVLLTASTAKVPKRYGQGNALAEFAGSVKEGYCCVYFTYLWQASTTHLIRNISRLSLICNSFFGMCGQCFNDEPVQFCLMTLTGKSVNIQSDLSNCSLGWGILNWKHKVFTFDHLHYRKNAFENGLQVISITDNSSSNKCNF